MVTSDDNSEMIALKVTSIHFETIGTLKEYKLARQQSFHERRLQTERAG